MANNFEDVIELLKTRNDNLFKDATKYRKECARLREIIAELEYGVSRYQQINEMLTETIAALKAEPVPAVKNLLIDSPMDRFKL